MNSHDSLVFALENYPEKVEAVEFDEILIDSARQNAKRPAFVKLAVPDEIVKGLKGSPDRRKNLVFVVSIPNEVAERADSPIILPNEVGGLK